MATGKGLYSKSVKLSRKDLKFIAGNKDKNEAKFKFQGQSARSQRWFDIDFDWIEVNFNTHEPYFYEKLFHIHEDTQDINTFKIFRVPIGNLKCVEIFEFYNDVPMIKYCQKSLNRFFKSSLESSSDSIEQTKSENSISLRT